MNNTESIRNIVSMCHVNLCLICCETACKSSSNACLGVTISCFFVPWKVTVVRWRKLWLMHQRDLAKKQEHWNVSAQKRKHYGAIIVEHPKQGWDQKTLKCIHNFCFGVLLSTMIVQPCVLRSVGKRKDRHIVSILALDARVLHHYRSLPLKCAHCHCTCISAIDVHCEGRWHFKEAIKRLGS